MIIELNIDEVSIIKIKNWFDHKWLNYSGKGIVYTEISRHPEKIAIDNFWKDKITVLPFNPNRVISEYFYRRRESGITCLKNYCTLPKEVQLIKIIGLPQNLKMVFSFGFRQTV